MTATLPLTRRVRGKIAGGIYPAAATARAPLGPLPTATPSIGNGTEQPCSPLRDTIRQPTVPMICPAYKPAPARLGIDPEILSRQGVARWRADSAQKRGGQHSGGRE